MSTDNQRASSRTDLTPFSEVLARRVRHDPAFGPALLHEAMEQLVANDVVTAQLLLRDVVNATVGFARLSQATGIPQKSLMRMLSAKGNPQARNLFEIIARLLELNDVVLEVHSRRRGDAKVSGSF